MTVPSKDEWDRLAEAYDRLQGETGDPYRRLVVDPALFELLGEIDHRTLLDAGCGNGYVANILRQKGGKVTACDRSGALIAAARRRFPEMQFDEADLTKALPYADRSFEIILSHLVFQDLADLTKPLTEFRRLLKPAGRLVLSITHPSFAYPATRCVRTLLDRLLRQRSKLVVDKYDMEGPVQAIVPGLNDPTIRYHRRLATYLRVFRGAGWQLTDLAEPIEIIKPTPTDQRYLSVRPVPAAYLPVSLTAAYGVPFTLLLECRPVDESSFF